MSRINRFEIYRQVVETLVPLRQAQSRWREKSRIAPGHFEWEVLELNVVYMPAVRLLPFELRERSLLDIWVERGRGAKVFSASWEPLELTRFKPGVWISRMAHLGATRILQ